MRDFRRIETEVCADHVEDGKGRPRIPAVEVGEIAPVGEVAENDENSAENGETDGVLTPVHTPDGEIQEGGDGVQNNVRGGKPVARHGDGESGTGKGGEGEVDLSRRGENEVNSGREENDLSPEEEELLELELGFTLEIPRDEGVTVDHDVAGRLDDPADIEIRVTGLEPAEDTAVDKEVAGEDHEHRHDAEQVCPGNAACAGGWSG